MSWLWDLRRFGAIPNYPIDRPIFLLGTQGGGLTLLSRMLRRHPDVICAAGNHHYWTSADELQNVYGLLLPFELTGLRYKSPRHAVFPKQRSWTYAARDLYPLYRKRACDATEQLGRVLRYAIRLSVLRHAQNPNSCRFIDKSQSYCVRVGLIAQLLKEHAPRFVLVPREPYVSVYRAAIGKASDTRKLLDRMSFEERLDVCAEHYGNSMRAAFQDCAELGLDLHIVPFERLLASPQGSLRDVCNFVGLDFRSTMLPAAEHRLPIGSRFVDRWYPLRTDVNRPYEAKLGPETVAAVHRHCDDLVERLGYARRSLGAAHAPAALAG